MYHKETAEMQACREAESITKHRELTEARSRGRIRHWELRRGLEQLEGRKRFAALFREA